MCINKKVQSEYKLPKFNENVPVTSGHLDQNDKFHTIHDNKKTFFFHFYQLSIHNNVIKQNHYY